MLPSNTKTRAKKVVLSYVLRATTESNCLSTHKIMCTSTPPDLTRCRKRRELATGAVGCGGAMIGSAVLRLQWFVLVSGELAHEFAQKSLSHNTKRNQDYNYFNGA
jgi:hypothetical protein